jgi:hypothetical protein
MSERKDEAYRVLWTEDLEEIDREIARMALLCNVRVLDPAIVRRVLKKDATVCGTDNPAAFRKLHDLLMLHLAERERSVDSFGQAQTAAIENYIVERLRKSFPDLAGEWPPKA